MNLSHTLFTSATLFGLSDSTATEPKEALAQQRLCVVTIPNVSRLVVVSSSMTDIEVCMEEAGRPKNIKLNNQSRP